MDQDYQGQGIMFKALMFCLDYIFNQFNLNRVMANYIPENTRSRKLLQRLGFEREGYARKYLMLNGEWKDH
ncbi:GNAT family N-acetyltransferase, partial [Aurantiacibacter luteus]|uniref:GNAT family N-acetyltransferase n=1 Tax=Aurantiacibacter luteus TaxID=1581420 RepID=UPI001F4C9040